MAFDAMNANLAAHLEAGSSPFYLVTITGPAGTLRYSLGRSVASLTVGKYLGKLLKLSRLPYSLAEGVSPKKITMIIDDWDRYWSSLIEGRYAATVERSLVTVHMGSADPVTGFADTVPGEWFLAFTGRLLGPGKQLQPHQYQIEAEKEVEFLRARVTKPRLTATDFPNAPSASLGKFGQVVYGVHTGETSKGGALIATHVDTVTHTYAAQLGAMKTLGTVYGDGVALGVGSKLFENRGGRLWTLIDFASARSEKVISFDCTGLEAAADGSGTAYSHPIEIMRHAIANWANGDYMIGTWLAEATAPIDTASWDAARDLWSAVLNVAGSQLAPVATLVLGGDKDERFGDVFLRFCGEWGLRPYWTRDGKVALYLEDFRAFDDDGVYPAEVLRATDIQYGALVPDHDPSTIARMAVRYGFMRSTGEARRTVETRDTLRASERNESLDMTMQAAVQSINREAARHVASRRVLLPSTPELTIKPAAKLWFAGLSIGDEIRVSHPDGPAADGAGWGIAETEGRLFAVEGLDLVPERNSVEMVLADRQFRKFTHVELLASTIAMDPLGVELENSLGYLTLGVVRTYQRASVGNYDSPGAQGYVVQIAANARPVSPDGLLIERLSKNWLKQNAGSLTGWTLGGAGAATVDTSKKLLDPTSTGVTGAVKLDANGATMDTITRTTIAITGQFTRLSIDHESDSVSGCGWIYQRLSDNQYWNDTTGAFQVGIITNSFASSTIRARGISKTIDHGAGGVAVSITLTTTTNNQNLWVYLAQIEDQKWASSRIINTTTENTRIAGTYDITNFVGRRCFWNRRGYAVARVKLNWDAADDTAVTHYVYRVFHDASNWESLYYDPANTRWAAERRVAGTTYRATLTHSPVRGGVYDLVVRSTGVKGELGLTDYTPGLAAFFLDVFLVDVATGVITKGTGIEGPHPYAAPTQNVSSNLFIGSADATGSQLDGFIQRFKVGAKVPTDSEIGRLVY